MAGNCSWNSVLIGCPTFTGVDQGERTSARVAVPTLWFYAARDPFYKDGVPQELRRYWQEAGGRAEFVFIAEHSLPNAHLALSDPKLWEQQADALLKTAETTKR